MKRTMLLLVMVVLVCGTGCVTLKELVDRVRNSTHQTEEPKPVPVNDDLDLSSVTWLGTSYAGAEQELIIKSARIDMQYVHTDYSPYSWSSITLALGRMILDAGMDAVRSASSVTPWFEGRVVSIVPTNTRIETLDAPGLEATEVDAICCLFYERDGRIVGGKFDWWRKGGQAKKVTHNLHGGYNGHTMPEAGTRTWTCIVSVNGKRRSNVKECSW